MKISIVKTYNISLKAWQRFRRGRSYQEALMYLKIEATRAAMARIKELTGECEVQILPGTKND